jgi:hypothetical protein
MRALPCEVSSLLVIRMDPRVLQYEGEKEFHGASYE